MNQSELISRLKVYGADIAGIEDRFMNDAELYQRCFTKFCTDKNFALLENALEEGDYTVAFAAAHSLKGTTGNMGLTPLYNSICSLVEALRAKQYGNITALYAEISNRLDQVKQLF